MSNTTNQSPTERAEALLTRWEQRLNPAGKSPSQESVQAPKTPRAEPTDNAVRRADGLLGRLGQQMNGRGLVRATAHIYVALAAKTGEVVDPIAKTWQESVDEARREQEQQAARTQGGSGARRQGQDEKEGEQALKKTAGAATDAAGAAA